MRLSHVLIKVKDLQTSVEAYKQKGFTVEYGTLKNPHNALIYFSEGPYIELVGNVKLPAVASFLLKRFGKRKLVERINGWHYSEEGLMAVCIENTRTNMNAEKEVLKRYQQKFFEKRIKRRDTKGRNLRFKVLFPDNVKIPFLMTYFDVDPKPKNYVHPNGIVGIQSVAFGTSEDNIPLIQELCEDDKLKLFIGEGVKDLQFTHAQR